MYLLEDGGLELLPCRHCAAATVGEGSQSAIVCWSKVQFGSIWVESKDFPKRVGRRWYEDCQREQEEKKQIARAELDQASLSEGRKRKSIAEIVKVSGFDFRGHVSNS